MMFFICVMLILSSVLMLIYTIGEPMSRQHEEDIRLTRLISFIQLIAAAIIGCIYKT